MAEIPGQGSLFFEGSGSNDSIIPNTGADLGSAGQVRQEANKAVASHTQSPDAEEEALKLMEQEIKANEKLISQTERKIKRQEAYKKATERTEAAIKSLQERNERDLRILTKEAGAWEPDKGLIIIDKDGKQQFMMPDEYKKALERGDELAEDFQKQLAARLTRKDLGVSASSMGGRSPDKPGFHIGDLVSAVTTGDFRGIARELMQPLGSGKLQKTMQERGAMIREGGAARGGFAGALRGLGGRAMAMAPMLMTPAALLGAQQLVSRVTKNVQSTITEGQVTGGGFGEGLASRREALQLAVNPFDMMDRRTAGEIVKGIRGRGFRGELGRALQDTVGDVFQDLGTDIEESMDILTNVVKENIMTIDEFRDTMRDLDDQAKETGLSVKMVQSNLKNVMDLAGAGGGIQASGIAMNAAEPLQEIFKNLEATRSGQLGSITQPILRQAALMHGVPAFMALGPEVQRNQAKFFDDYADYL